TAEQPMDKRSKGTDIPSCQGWTEGIGVSAQISTGLGFVRAAEIARYSKPMVQVAGHGGIPTIRATGAVKIRVLIATKNFRFRIFLSHHCQRGQQEHQGDANKLTHVLHSSRLNLHPLPALGSESFTPGARLSAAEAGVKSRVRQGARTIPNQEREVGK